MATNKLRLKALPLLIFFSAISTFLASSLPGYAALPPQRETIYFETTRTGKASEISSAIWNGNSLENIVLLTNNSIFEFNPSVSPQGVIIYSREMSEDRHHIIAHPETVLIGDLGINTNSVQAWSPDGRSFTYASNRDGSFNVYVSDSDGRNETALSKGHSPAWSPDGNQIAFIKMAKNLEDMLDSGRLFILETKNGKVRQIAERDKYRMPTWIGTDEIVVTEDVPGVAGCLTYFNIKTGAKKQLTRPPSPHGSPSDTNGGCFFDFGAVHVLGGLMFTRYVANDKMPGGAFQLYYMKTDGTGLMMLTYEGNNLSPSTAYKGQ